MLDRYWFGDVERISPEAPVPVVQVNNTDDRPGGAGNVALNIAALGATVILLSVVGDDEAADILAAQLTAASVIHHLHRLPMMSTLVKLRVISRHQQLLRLDFEKQITIDDSHQFLEYYQQHLIHADLVVLSDYQKGTLSDPQQLIQLARQASVPILVDPKGNDFSIYRGSTMITPNYKEFEAVVGCCHQDQSILLKKGQTLLKEYQIETLLVTRGEAGMTLIEPQRSIQLPAYAREVFDVTGAGDTVIAVLAVSLAIGMKVDSAMILANLAASLVVGKLGATSVSTAELEAALRKKSDIETGIVNEKQLLQAIHLLRSRRKRIVFANGCFDVLHAGHVQYLKYAKQLGDYLIVAINDDESVKRLKGFSRPVNPLMLRMKVLEALSVVDWVVSFSDDTPERLLHLIRPDVLVKGGDYSIDEVVGADIVRAYGGVVHVIHHDLTALSSTSLLIQMGEQTVHDQYD